MNNNDVAKAEKVIFKIILTVLSMALVWYLTRERGTLIIEEPTEVVSKPFPPGWGYEKIEGKNKVLKVLQPGHRIKFSDRRYEKDFAYYDVEVDGREGYIISGPGYRHEE